MQINTYGDLEEYIDKNYNGNKEEFYGVMAKAMVTANSEKYNLSLQKIKEIMLVISEEDKKILSSKVYDLFKKYPNLLELNKEYIDSLYFIKHNQSQLVGAKENPFRAKISKTILQFLIGGTCLAVFGLSIAGSGMKNNSDATNYIISAIGVLFTVFFAAKLGFNVFCFVRFQKARENYYRVRLEGERIIKKWERENNNMTM